MKIALLTDGISPFVIGGMQKHSYYLCKYLAANKIYIHLYHTASEVDEPDLTTCFTVEELKYIKSYFILFPGGGILPGHYLRASFRFSDLIFERYNKEEPADIIYAQGLTGRAFLKAKLKGVVLPPICVNVHGYEYYQKSGSFKSWLSQLLLRPSFYFINKEADFIYSFGGKITRIIEEHIKGRKGKIFDIPAGIESGFLTETLPSVNHPRKFIFVGRYERRKGIEELNRAIIQLEGNYDFTVDFIGNIPKEKQLGLSCISYLGLIHDKEVINSTLKESDILVCPSYAEGMPNVILEAMASGCAIIATDVGAVSQMVDDSNGWLIAPGSYKAIKKTMISAILISDQELLKKKNFSVSYIKTRFLWNVIAEKLIESFNHIISDHSLHRSGSL
jgi:glycosyltransferase involved in cell wall biosynthesis